MNIEQTHSLAGTYEFMVRKSDGSIRLKLGPFKNLITNLGMDDYCTAGTLFANSTACVCEIGNGVTPATFADTALESVVASQTNGVLSGFTQPVSPGRFVRCRIVFSFPIDAYLGTITEVGVRKYSANTPGRRLFTRAILPTPITLIPGDQLEVTYNLYHNLPEDDWVKVITINGIDYTFTGRAIELNATSTASGNSFSGYEGGWTNGGSGYFCNAEESDVLLASTALIPFNTSARSALGVYDTYIPGSFEVAVSHRWRIGDVNYPTGIGRIFFDSNNCSGSYQFKISPKIPKDATNMLTFKIRAKFTRGTPPE